MTISRWKMLKIYEFEEVKSVRSRARLLQSRPASEATDWMVEYGERSKQATI